MDDLPDIHQESVGKVYTLRGTNISHHGVPENHRLKTAFWKGSLVIVHRGRYSHWTFENNSHRIHVWYIYLHEWLIFMVNVGKYTSPMDGMGLASSLRNSREHLKKSNDSTLPYLFFCQGNNAGIVLADMVQPTCWKSNGWGWESHSDIVDWVVSRNFYVLRAST